MKDKNSRPVNILLIEDEKINQKVAQSLLKSRGWRIITALDGQEGIEKFNQEDFDVILVDIHMPKLNGFQVTNRIRRIERHQGRYTPIIGMSASDIPKDKEKFVGVEMDSYILKPLRAEELYQTIETLLSKYKRPLCPIDIEAVLANLEGDKDLLKELIEDFIEEEYSILLLKEIEEAINQKDYNKLYKKAHKLKGAAACLQIQGIYEIAYKLEQCGKALSNEGIVEIFEALKKEYQITKDALENYRWED
ncbi:response regulator [Natronincola ferrireducens]|uniref:Stage 0 sporulation protein A homolog n=1 Tax=Natronincola ferrireducens TaxID=393762 RepID=A0A1G9EJ82_9FIRM|nr:response regulator [Natronincola ferrireducens]SDK76237.1 Hpt domain-containing protein [Natronincola ferrireducens]